MKQIAHLSIENFQSHARSEFRFREGLNVIIGASDHGKSAVLRALRWALYNEPRGSEFVRSGARECRVTVTMSDGAIIQRELLLTKSGAPARNRYSVTVPGQQPALFEGFGTEVPAEVLRAHGMPQVLLDTDKRVQLSFGSQLEGPFLMAETGSLRARAIGRLLGVHVVDAAVRGTQRDQRTVRLEVTRLERELQRFETELEPYADIPGQEEQLTRAQQCLERAEQQGVRLQRLEAARVERDRAEAEAIRTEGMLCSLSELERAATLLRSAEEGRRQAAKLERLQVDLSQLEQESGQARVRIEALRALPGALERAREAARRQERLVKLRRLEGDLRGRERDRAQAERLLAVAGEVPRADGLVRQAGERLQRLKRLQEQLTPLREVEERLVRGRQLLRDQEGALQDSLREYEAALLGLGRCPTCSQPVAPEAIRRIVADLGRGADPKHHHD